MSSVIYPLIYSDISRVAPIPIDAWNKLAENFTFRDVGKRDCFLSAGDDSSQFGIILEGVFRLYYVRPDGKEFTKTFRAKSEVIGDLASMLKGNRSRIFIEAVKPSKVIVGNYYDFMKLADTDLAWSKVFRDILEKSYLDKEQREYELLQLSATERYENFLEEYADISTVVPNYQIASYLGITAVALSRIVNSGKNA
ncbi:MAG: CRP-like cAMP-binding protein [Thermoproteota archaeon]|jgi:CRP-like cAMP-binding protein